MSEQIQTNKPRAFDLTDPSEVRRLLWETIGYMRVSRNHGTDTEGRRYALEGLEALYAMHKEPQP